MGFKANNVCSLQDHSLKSLEDYENCFFFIGFNDKTYPLIELIFNAYLNVSKDLGFNNSPEAAACKRMIDLEGGEEDTIGNLCESIISYSISFMYCLLENPGIWGDIPDGEGSNEVEKFVENNIFKPEKVKHML